MPSVGFHPTLYCASPSETKHATAFEASFSDTASATAEHVAATAETSSKIRQGMVIVRVLDGIVKNKYANDPGKLAAWISAKPRRESPEEKGTANAVERMHDEYRL